MSNNRRVISAQEIIDAHSSHIRILLKSFSGDIVTDEARDRAENSRNSAS